MTHESVKPTAEFGTISMTTPSRGKLHIFLGYASGVGKTSAMLQAALKKQAEGVDVVCAIVEAYELNSGQELLAGFECITPQAISIDEHVSKEMDLYAVLARRPALVVVDDLEHINARGLQHPRRYQDIEELLDNGIDVYTTLNIYHVESLNDVIRQITGITVKATVPDRLFENAVQIEFVDILPEDLLKRLAEGNVQIPEQDPFVVDEFYRLGNLQALRELALRHTAQHVDRQMRNYMANKSIMGPWAAAERLLVCISSSPMSRQLVRKGCRLANELKAEWFVVYVEEPPANELAESHQKQLYDTMKLAEELGANVERITGASVADALIAFARHQNITKIIIGQPYQPRWKKMITHSIVNDLIQQSGNIDVYIMNSGSAVPSPGRSFANRFKTGPASYIQSGIIILLATLMAILVNNLIVLNPANLVMFYLLAVVVIALRFDYGPAVLTATVSVLLFNFLFIPPQYTLHIAEAQYLLTFSGLFTAGIVIASLTTRAHYQTQAARQREYEKTQLLSLTKELSATVDAEETIQRVVHHIRQTFGYEVGLYLVRDTDLQLATKSNLFLADEIDLGLVNWAFTYKQSAGMGTGTKPEERVYYLPLVTANHSLGVLALLVESPIIVAKQHLLHAFASQVALAMEAVQLGEQAQQAQLLREKERLLSILLNSISHDLRTPLVSITGTLSSLLDQESQLNVDDQHDLLIDAFSEAERLNHIVGNLLEMSRLEAGSLRLNRELYDLSEVIGVARAQLRKRLGDRQIIINFAENLPLIKLDITLFAQVFVNLFDNALKYSMDDTPIEIHAQQIGSELEIKVGDRGIGIPEDEIPRIFNKFFRASNVERSTGSGLGLAICQGVVEAHRGTISVQARLDGGTWFIIRLPLESEEDIYDEN